MRLLSTGDMLALIDRAAPIVGEIQDDSDPVGGCMLRREAVALCEQLSLRITGMPAAELERWVRRNGWKCRPKAAPGEQQQLEVAQANSRTAVQIRADAYAVRMLPVIREVQAAGAHSLGAIVRALNARGVRPARGERWCHGSVQQLLRRAAKRGL